MEQLIERMNKAPLGVKFAAMAAVVVALTGLNFFLFIQEMTEKQTAQLNTIGALEKTLVEKQTIAQNLTEKKLEMDRLEQRLQEALTELPEKKDMEEILAQLNDMGKKSGLEIATVTPGQESNAQFFARIPIRVSVTGNYHEVALFLQDISNMRRIVNVNNIKFTMGQTKSDKVVLNSDFLATTFRFLDQPKKAGDK